MNPWPWAIAGTFVLFAVVQAVLITIAATHFEPPDDPQYYKHSVEYSQKIRALQRQRDEGWRFAWNLPAEVPAGPPVDLRLEVTNGQGRPLEHAGLSVKVGRPATTREDRTLPLREGPSGVYTLQVSLAPGTWDFAFLAVRGDLSLTHRLRLKIVAAPL